MDVFVKEHKKFSLIALGVALAVILGGAINGIESSSTTPSASTSAGSSPPSTAPIASTPAQRVQAALGSSIRNDLAIGSSRVRSVTQTGRTLNITLTTPSGGFQGPSTQDADSLASVALSKTYLAGWSGATYVEFDGGLASKATGQAEPNATAFAYLITGHQARRIDWSSQSDLYNIDWSLYRTVCVPVFKGCS